MSTIYVRVLKNLNCIVYKNMQCNYGKDNKLMAQQTYYDQFEPLSILKIFGLFLNRAAIYKTEVIFFPNQRSDYKSKVILDSYLFTSKVYWIDISNKLPYFIKSL